MAEWLLCLKRKMDDFYTDLTPYYHLIFEDWDKSIAWQANQISDIIRDGWGSDVETILDASCGIGTQAIGLAQKGFRVTASDLAPGPIERAIAEASAREVDMSVAQIGGIITS
ncbi:MAG: class I SAM-dependent methyltransferase [bacterium]